MGPYRTSREPADEPATPAERDHAMAFGLGILVLASLALVIGTLVRGETFGGEVGSSRVDLQACKLEYSIVSPK